MILYTPVQPELIFEGAGDGAALSETVLCDIGGVQVLVSLSGMNKGNIERVLSTDPMVYLDDRLAPGRTVTFDSGEFT